MSTVCFQNQGLMELDAIKTFGISVKNSESPIGYFGTGLKYAIAILMREEQELSIFIGRDEYQFTVKKEDMRGKEFEFIYMNDEKLPFTTELGKNWRVWQAYREIYANCLDEGGSDGAAEPRKGYTTIVVRGDGFSDVAAEKNKYFLDTSTLPIAENDKCALYKGESLGIFRRGILAFEMKLPYTINLKYAAELTEDRTLMYINNDMYKITNFFIKDIGAAELEEVYTGNKERPFGLYKPIEVNDLKECSQDFRDFAFAKGILDRPSKIIEEKRYFCTNCGVEIEK